MRLKLSSAAVLAISALATGSVAVAQSSTPQAIAAAMAKPVARVKAPVVNDTLVTLKGNTHPLAQARYDQGAAASSLGTGRLQLLLKRSDAQQVALKHYLASLQDPHSASYHKWLTPKSYGTQFGIADSDLQAVESWLQSEGFKIDAVPASRNLIQFSGTAGQVANAFHTSIHSYKVNGVQHYSNASDPQIPAALAPVIAGISPLNNFRALPQNAVSSHAQVKRAANGRLQVVSQSTRSATPLLTSSDNNVLYVTPADAATIYNAPNLLNSNYTGTTPVVGNGVNIGIAGYSDLQVADYQNYRNLFLNGAGPADPNLVVDGVDPGVLYQHDGQETLLDTEIAAGLAPFANIYVYSSQSDLVEDGLTNAIIRAIQDNVVSVLTVSYSRCEAALGDSGNYEFNELWQEAAAQGISVVVAAGDTGSAACDDGSATSATGGLAVNGYASTPYNIAVGGTDFDTLASNFAQYVNANTTGGAQPYNGNSPYLGSALGYIPENPWNDSITNNPPGSFTGNTASQYSGSDGSTYDEILAGGGGASSVAYCAAGNDPTTGQCADGVLSGYPAPSFQTGFTANGAPTGVRTLPDVSMFSGDNRQYPAAWAFCSDNQLGQADYTFTDCSPASDGTFSVEGVGGTSASAAAFAGVLGMVVESQNGTRLGVANNVLYNLSATGTSVFHDVTDGNNSVPCTAGSPNCGSNGFLNGYDAGTGYDLAGGLGSIDASALITAWSNVTFATTTVTLQADGGAGPIVITHGTPVTLSTAVTPADATGTVTVQGPMGFGAMSAPLPIPLVNGAGSVSTNALPGGTYQVYAYYPGDTTHSPSQSDPIDVNVSPESDTLALSFAIQDVNSGASLPTTSPVTFPFGSYGFLYVQPIPSSGSTGIPTGEIALSDTNFGFVGGQVINAAGKVAFPLYDYTPGNFNIIATYGGDNSYSPSQTPTPTPVIITKGPTALSATVAPTAIDYAATTTVTAVLTTDSASDIYPTGNIAVTVNGKSYTGTVVNSLSSVNSDVETATITIPGNTLINGANTLTVTYPGDGNYLASTTSVVVNVSGAPGASFTLVGPDGGITIPTPGPATNANIQVVPANGFSGDVNLTCAIGANQAISPPTCSITPTVSLSGGNTGTAILTINTIQRPVYSASAQDSGHDSMRRLLAGGGGLALCGVLLFSVPSRRRSWRAMLAVLLAFGTLGIVGCGFTAGPGQGTTAGTYDVTVTGTSGSTSASTHVAVVVR